MRRVERLRTAPLVAMAAVAAAAGYVALVDPHRAGHYPACPFHALTGWYCPGCGGLRMVHDLLTGQLSRAAHDNLLVLALLPVGGYLWLRSLRPGAARSRLLAPVPLYCLLALVVVFWVARNLPPGHWLAP